jgi:Ca2+-binding RTX toxin-like protein
MLQKAYAEFAYDDVTDFTMDGIGRLYVVRNKSTSGAALVRLNQLLREDGTFSVAAGVKEIAASLSGRYVYYTTSSGPRDVVRRIDTISGTTVTSAPLGSDRSGDPPLTIQRFAAVGDDFIIASWDAYREYEFESQNWLPVAVKIGLFRFGEQRPIKSWSMYGASPGVIGVLSDGRLGSGWDYRLAYNLATGITAFAERCDKFTYAPTGRTHDVCGVTGIYRTNPGGGLDLHSPGDPASAYPDWETAYFEPAYTANGALIYRSHPAYEGRANLIDAVYAADQATGRAYADGCVDSWAENGATARLDDSWKNPPDAGTDVSMQYLADYQGNIVIVRREEDALSGDAGRLTLIKFAPSAAAGRAIVGTPENDELSGTPGRRDYFYGDGGNDVYIWNVGDGDDVINDFSPGKAGGETGALRFGGGVTPDDVEARHNASDVIFFVKSTGESVTVAGWLKNYESQLTSVTFGDGTAWTREQVNAAPLILRGSGTIINVDMPDLTPGASGSLRDRIIGGAGNDVVFGAGGHNQIHGGPGDDYIIGGKGSDEYVWQAGDGRDLVNDYSDEKVATDAEMNCLAFHDLTPADVEPLPDGAGLLFKVASPGGDGSANLMNWFLHRSFQLGSVKFNNSAGETIDEWTNEYINGKFPILETGDADETLELNRGDASYVYAKGGNDAITIRGGGHVVNAGPGDDTLIFTDPSAANVIAWNAGDGTDVVTGSYGSCSIAFGAGVTPRGVLASMDGDDMILSVRGGGLRLVNYRAIRAVTFADGTTWTGGDLDAIAAGRTTPFSFTMRQVAQAYWDSLEEPAERSREGSGGCDAIGMSATLPALWIAIARRRKRQK